jgi:ketosteroid isomerase-like protein
MSTRRDAHRDETAARRDERDQNCGAPRPALSLFATGEDVARALKGRPPMNHVSLVAVIALLVTLGQQQPDDQRLIRQTRAQQNTAIARKDFAAVASYWTEDVSIRAGLGRAIQGRREYLAAFVADSAMTYEREPTEIVVSAKWPLAYERGRWTGRLRKDGKQALLSGAYSAQWVKTGTRWLIRSEVFVALDCTPPACDRPAVVP